VPLDFSLFLEGLRQRIRILVVSAPAFSGGDIFDFYFSDVALPCFVSCGAYSVVNLWRLD
jgi:hypothetical protein